MYTLDNSFRKILLAVLVSLPSLSLASLVTLKDTYSILPAHKKYLSIITGAVFWHTGWMNNFYTLSNDYPIITSDDQARAVISYDKEKTDGIKKLVYTLFYRVPGSTSYNDFSTTQFIATKDPLMLANLVAQLMVSLDAIESQPQDVPYKDTDNKLLALVKKLLSLSATKYAKISAPEFVAAMLEGLQLAYEGKYPGHLVQSIWLSFLYKTLDKLCGAHPSKNRLALVEYYKTLGTALKIPLNLNQDDNFPTILTPLSAQKHLEELLKGYDTKNEKLEELLFYAMKSKTFPTLPDYTKVEYRPNSASRSVHFFDCMENSIANFIRIMSYDTQLATNTTQALEKRLGIVMGEHPKERLKPFLSNIQDHTLWAQLMSNIAYIPYL